jgi:hypothetical protein
VQQGGSNEAKTHAAVGHRGVENNFAFFFRLAQQIRRKGSASWRRRGKYRYAAVSKANRAKSIS